MSTAPPTDTPAAPPPNPAFPDHPDWAGPQRFAALCAVAGLAAYGVAGGVNLASAGTEHAEAAKGQFFQSWLAGYIYWLSLPVGGLALLMIHGLAKTSWGLLMKRPLEAATRTLPVMLVLFLPIIAATFMHDVRLYPWTEMEAHLKAQPDAGSKAALEEWQHRQEGTFHFLSPIGFVVVSAVCFLVWGVIANRYNAWDKETEANPSRVEVNLKKQSDISGPGLILYAILGTAFATQVVMSLEPSWASTMFPVIYSVNQMLTALAFCMALFLTLSLRPPLKNIMRPKFQIDMGSFMLALTLFWSYTSFSQMMLVWIGNLPEEIPFYLRRSNNTGWWYISAGLIVFHFALPFLLLLFRDIKLHPKRLRAMALYILVVCAIDVVWWVEPSHPKDGVPLFWVMDIGAIVGIGGIFGLAFLWQLRQRPLLPTHETYQLPEGHAHHEHH